MNVLGVQYIAFESADPSRASNGWRYEMTTKMYILCRSYINSFMRIDCSCNYSLRTNYGLLVSEYKVMDRLSSRQFQLLFVSWAIDKPR